MMRWISFKVRDPVRDLEDLLRAAGSLSVAARWELSLIEAAGDWGAAEELHRISDAGLAIDGAVLQALAEQRPQLIEGWLKALDPDQADPWLILRAVDGTEWDVGTDPETSSVFQVMHPDADDITERYRT
jgi:hypothetical protein